MTQHKLSILNRIPTSDNRLKDINPYLHNKYIQSNMQFHIEYNNIEVITVQVVQVTI